MDDETLDLTGLKCPLPALFAARALRRGQAGQVLVVIADDPLAAIDVPHMCAAEGHEVESVKTGGGTTRFVLRRGPL